MLGSSIEYCSADQYNTYTVYNPADIRWHVLNNSMSQYYLCICLWAHYPDLRSVAVLNRSSRHRRGWRGRVTQARILILKSFGATVLRVCMTYSVTQVTKYFYLAETWRGGLEISDVTGYNSGYWFLGVTISVSHNYNGLLCA